MKRFTKAAGAPRKSQTGAFGVICCNALMHPKKVRIAARAENATAGEKQAYSSA
ncbi:hypothetical protein [Mesorhizobium sp. ORM8.1]